MTNSFRRRANKAEIDADIESYLAEKTDSLIAAGLSPEAARQRARREFGNVTLLKELSGEEWNWGTLEQIWMDIKYAIRSLRRNPVFALTAICTLALGIGANAAIFNLLHAVILRTLPVPDAEQLRLFSVVGPQKDPEFIFSYPVLKQMQAATVNSAKVAGFTGIARLKFGESELADTELVSGNFFDTLRIQPEAGRLLTAADDQATANYPAVLSDAFWSRRYGRDPAIIGQSIDLNDTPVTVAGVAARTFCGLSPGRCPDFWLPVSAQNDIRYKQNVWNSNGHSEKPFMPQPEIRWLSLVARVPDPRNQNAVSLAINQVYALDMQREVKGWPDDPQGARDLLASRIRLEAGDKGLGDLRHQFSAPLTVLMCASGMVLLIASVNLASLALARAIARRKELAVRCSIGASRSQILRQFAIEIGMLSLVGGLAALPVVAGASNLLLRWASGRRPMALDSGLHWPVLLFVFVASLVAGIIFGLLPSLEAVNFPLAEAIKAQSSAVKGMRLPWGRTLLTVQVAFSFVLLSGAVMFVRTFINYTNVDVGFAPEHVLSVQVDPLGAHFTPDQLPPLYDRVLDAVRNLPSVRSASLAECGLAIGRKSVSGIQLEHHPGEDHNIQSNTVNPEYFATVGMRLLAGRFFTPHDRAKKPVLAVINATAARVLFSDVKPIGQHYGYGRDTGMFEIIGIVADARVNDLHEPPRPMAYYSLEQSTEYVRSLEVRAQGDPRTIEESIRTKVHAVAPTLPVMSVTSLTEQVSGNLLRERLIARLASAFALLALGLACLGIYGVLSYAITRRTSEIGIRLALGAEAARVRWMVLREALAVICIGLALGIPIAIALTQFVRGLLYGLSAGDPVSLAAGASTLICIAVVAAYIPAWRASKVDPSTALRYE